MDLDIAFLFLVLNIVLFPTGHTKRFTLRHDKKYYVMYTFNISARSSIECAAKCNEISSCTFYSYNVVDSICLIHSTDIYSGQMTMQTDLKWRIYEPNKACLKAWKVYQYYCYYFSKDQKNWTDAKSSCQSIGSMLAEVVSSNQRDFLKTKAEEIRYTFWLGGTDIVTEGEWIWTTSQTTFTFTDWNSNNPSNDDGSEHCLEMRQPIDFLWNDNFCYYTNNYICQRPSRRSVCIGGESRNTRKSQTFDRKTYNHCQLISESSTPDSCRIQTKKNQC